MNKKMDNLKSLIAKRRARFQSARPVRQSAAPKAVSPKQPEAPVASVAPVEAPAEIPETPVAPAEIPETPAVPETPVVEVTEAPAEEVAAPVEEAPVAEEVPAAETDVFGRSVKKRRSRKVKEVEENG